MLLLDTLYIFVPIAMGAASSKCYASFHNWHFSLHNSLLLICWLTKEIWSALLDTLYQALHEYFTDKLYIPYIPEHKQNQLNLPERLSILIYVLHSDIVMVTTILNIYIMEF